MTKRAPLKRQLTISQDDPFAKIFCKQIKDTIQDYQQKANQSANNQVTKNKSSMNCDLQDLDFKNGKI
jgi:hypothetical protein